MQREHSLCPDAATCLKYRLGCSPIVKEIQMREVGEGCQGRGYRPQLRIPTVCTCRATVPPAAMVMLSVLSSCALVA